MEQIGNKGLYDAISSALTGAPAATGFEPDPESIRRKAEEESNAAGAAEKALVNRWQDRIIKAKGHWDKVFRKMKQDMAFARGKQWTDDAGEDRYVANITLRTIAARTAAIYAKNPTFTAKRRPRLDFELWDGRKESLSQAIAAMMDAQQAGTPAPAEAAALLADVEQGKKQRQMMKRISETLQVLMTYHLNEVQPRFKIQAKQLIRRVRTVGVGYIEVGYQRMLKHSPEVAGKIADATEQLAHLERLVHELKEGEIDEHSADRAELKTAIETLQAQKQLIVREGLVFDFPRAHEIIIDPAVTQLRGFVGADWIAREYIMDKAKAEEIYKIDLGSGFKPYSGGKATGADLACVWRVFDLVNGQEFVLCDGFCGYLRQPGPPDVFHEQGHPWHVLTFNDLEDDECPYPPSDVELIKHQQREINRARDSVRSHRIANRPAWVGATGLFSDEDKTKLGSHEINEFLELEAIPASGDTDIRTKLMAKPTIPIDPATYETDSVFSDVLRVVGDQDANLGPTSGATATESSIAESSRMSSIQSNVDDLDEFLTDVARDCGAVLLHEMSEEWVKKIAGRGAVWPTLNREEIASEIYLEVKAGSSGRPNRQLKLSNLERVAPFLIQSPDLNPQWLVRTMVAELDDGIDVEDAILEGMPSIISQNAARQVSTGNPASDPAQQGAAGGGNAPRQNTRGGPQAAMPAPAGPGAA